MKPVVQEDVSGCGIAAVATLAGITYAEAKAKASSLNIQVADPLLWSDTHYVRQLLEAFSIASAADERPFRSWADLPDAALLAIKWRIERGQPFWHWVVFSRESGEATVFDSKQALKSNIRRDFGRMKPKWYIEIKR